MSRVVIQRVLPDGRVCIHLFVRSEDGPVQNPSGDVNVGKGTIRVDGAKGYIACNRAQNTVLPQQRGAETLLCTYSDDTRAVSCPKCRETPEWQGQQAELDSLVDNAAMVAA